MAYYRVQLIATTQKTNEYLVQADSGEEAVNKANATLAAKTPPDGVARVGNYEEHTLNCSHTPTTAGEFQMAARV